jgi:glycosyltransferase involved in cell wall biosynthesis
MKILFITDLEVNPLSGGIERITYNLSESFRKIGHEVHCITADADIYNLLTKTSFDVIISKILKKNNTKTILPKIYELTRTRNTKLIACFHNLPTYELYGRNKIIHFLKKIGLTFLVKWHIIKKLKYFLNSDCIFFESPCYIPIYKELVKDNTHVYAAIPNALGFDEWFDPKNLSNKQNEALMVVRFDESQKRITLALRIWKEIENSGLFENWTLRIVGGGGPDEKFINNFANKIQLKNVCFEGRQKPEPYYRKASIFMMTSAYEGFPMTLGEAHQFGVVPIAFDSFSAIHDIIENEKNGIIVKNNDQKKYIEQLKRLMQNKEKREKMAQNGLISSKRFSEEKIVKQWELLLKKLVQTA